MAKSSTDKTHVSFRLSAVALAALARLASAKGVSKTAVLEMVLREAK